MLTDALAEMFQSAADERSVRAYSASLLGIGESAADAERAAEVEAMLEGMYLMAASDGEVASDELLQLSASLRAMLEAFQDGSAAETALPLFRLNETLAKFEQSLARDGVSARLEAIAAKLRTPEAACLAFSLAAAIAFVDDFVATGEADAIDQFAQALGFEPDESQHLLREVHARLDD
ncbi:MAG TPA: hypothetical protein PKD61_35425 [Polyangiaceae bacterium]|nr:hypothetical protein [Polyangiaceae bacterium]